VGCPPGRGKSDLLCSLQSATIVSVHLTLISCFSGAPILIGLHPMSHPRAHEESLGEIYRCAFWLVFIANLFLCAANTLTFRFAEFITFLGGSDEHTGRIVAVGLVASIFWRAFLGQAIDRFGVRNVWLFSTVVYLIGTWMLVTTDQLNWQIYAARAIFIIGISSMFATALSFVQGLAPLDRRTEIIGTYGASGFLGMICGAQLGDYLFSIYPAGGKLFQVLFGITLVLGATHGLLAIFMTGRSPHARPDVVLPMHSLVIRYWPRVAVLATTLMGLTVAISTVFLTRYATERGITGLRLFFTVYAVTAFTMRLTARNWSRVMGRHRLIVLGLASQLFAFLALLPVSQSWHLIPSGICFGFGQALLFPCIVSLCSGAFPEQYRGTGTTLTLSAIDMGTMVTAPVMGWLIDQVGYGPMLVLASLVLVTGAGMYALLTWRIIDSDMRPAVSTRLPAAAMVQEGPLTLTPEPVPLTPVAIAARVG